MSSLTAALAASQEKVRELKEATGGGDRSANALRFKHEVLLDMLAVATADEKAASVR